MRLGILGGTFDPVHFGHLRVAEEMGEAFELDGVYLIPAAIPPHKGARPVTDFHHRLKMIELALEDSPYIKALDMEGRREGPSYSIETLKEIRQIHPEDLELFFIIGTDAFLEIETWKDYKRLFEYSHFIVIQRPGKHSWELETFIDDLGMGFRRRPDDSVFIHPTGTKIFYREPTLMDISSTLLRNKVRQGKSIRYLVPEAVIGYIRTNKLYGNLN